MVRVAHKTTIDAPKFVDAKIRFDLRPIYIEKGLKVSTNQYIPYLPSIQVVWKRINFGFESQPSVSFLFRSLPPLVCFGRFALSNLALVANSFAFCGSRSFIQLITWTPFDDWSSIHQARRCDTGAGDAGRSFDTGTEHYPCET